MRSCSTSQGLTSMATSVRCLASFLAVLSSASFFRRASISARLSLGSSSASSSSPNTSKSSSSPPFAAGGKERKRSAMSNQNIATSAAVKRGMKTKQFVFQTKNRSSRKHTFLAAAFPFGAEAAGALYLGRSVVTASFAYERRIRNSSTELVREDASHLHMEMGHLWYKSYSLHSIGLRGGTSQHGRSDQICLYSETVGPDWSGHAHLQVRTRGAEACEPLDRQHPSNASAPPSTYARCGCG
jgi:hypothetical protein